jgi:hypothetical protein
MNDVGFRGNSLNSSFKLSFICLDRILNLVSDNFYFFMFIYLFIVRNQH